MQMMDEMKRILSNEKAIVEAKSKWDYYIPRIIKQAKMEKGMQIEKKVQEIAITDEDSKTNSTWYYNVVLR